MIVCSLDAVLSKENKKYNPPLPKRGPLLTLLKTGMLGRTRVEWSLTYKMLFCPFGKKIIIL